MIYPHQRIGVVIKLAIQIVATLPTRDEQASTVAGDFESRVLADAGEISINLNAVASLQLAHARIRSAF